MKQLEYKENKNNDFIQQFQQLTNLFKKMILFCVRIQGLTGLERREGE